MNRNVEYYITNSAFSNYAEKIWVYLKDALVKGSNYDPFRNTGYTKSNQNPLSVKAMVKQLQANSLIMRELGLTVSGSIEVIIKRKDVALIKLAEKITYDNIEYSVYNKALGSRIQIYKKPFGFYHVVLFQVGK